MRTDDVVRWCIFSPDMEMDQRDSCDCVKTVASSNPPSPHAVALQPAGTQAEAARESLLQCDDTVVRGRFVPQQ